MKHTFIVVTAVSLALTMVVLCGRNSLEIARLQKKADRLRLEAQSRIQLSISPELWRMKNVISNTLRYGYFQATAGVDFTNAWAALQHELTEAEKEVLG